MSAFTIYEFSTGVVDRLFYGSEAAATLQLRSGEAYIEGEWPSATYYISAGVPTLLPPVPNPSSRWKGEEWEDLRTLEEAKTAKLAEINAARLAASRGNFTYGGKAFAADELARSDIDGINGYVTLMGEFPPNWPGGWRAVDGTSVAITTVADWQAFYAAMVVQGVDFFLYAQSLRSALQLAESLAQVDEIQWSP